jgi:hypothetical protein
MTKHHSETEIAYSLQPCKLLIKIGLHVPVLILRTGQNVCPSMFIRTMECNGEKQDIINLLAPEFYI